jgi:hypothetical protein
MNMFVVNTFSELEEALGLQVREMLLRGDISEQVLDIYALVYVGSNWNGAYQETMQAVCQNYDALDFSGRGKLAWLLLSRRVQNKIQK